jgi:hypothetical protein
MQHRQTTPTSSTKSVTFSEKASMRLALHINEYTAKEIHKAFYSSTDFIAFKDDVKRTLRMIEMKLEIDENSCCTTTARTARGVEWFMQEASRSRLKTRRASRLAVFNEQLHQFYRCDGSNEEELEMNEESSFQDDEKIAAVYAPLVCESAASACAIGLADEMAAKAEETSSRRREEKQNIELQTPSLTEKRYNIANKPRKLMKSKGERGLVLAKRREFFALAQQTVL